VQGTGHRFDLGALFRAVDDARTAQGLSWSALSNEVRVAATTIRRFSTASDAEADGVLAVVRWLGVAPEVFICDSRVEGEGLAAPSDGMVRVDLAAVNDADDDHRNAQQQRTTIQRVARVAQHTKRSVASFTRRTPW
jgi:hypothetical protein